MIAEKTVGYTKFFFDKKKINKETTIIIKRIKQSVSDKTPAGNIIVLDINAAKVE